MVKYYTADQIGLQYKNTANAGWVMAVENRTVFMA